MKISINRLCLYVCPYLLLATVPSLLGKDNRAEDDGISYEIIAQPTIYKAGSSATVKVMVINRSNEVIFISRGIGRCSKWSGHSEIQLLNQRGENVLHSGCDITELPIADADLKDTLHNPDLWIQLLPDEIYGEEDAITIPNRRGNYRIRAELWPPGFPEQQKKLLKEQGLRVLKHTHVAPVVEIKID